MIPGHEKSHRPTLVLIAGYSGVLVSFLSVLAYVLRISLTASASSEVLNFSLILLNSLVWGIGSGLRRSVTADQLGRALVILAEALFPLNLYSLSFQYFPPFKGEASLSVSAALSAALVYHVSRYAYFGGISYPVNFYPYFFTGSAGSLIVLSHFTLGLPFADIVWLLLGFTVAFHAAVRYVNCQPRAHFSLALLFMLMGALVLSALTFSERATVQLLSFFVGAGILFTLVWSSRNLGPIRQLFGVAWYMALLLSSAETLYFLSAPSPAYVGAAIAWVWALMAVWVFLRAEEFQPLNDPAYWLSFLLGLGLVGYWSPFWSALADLHLKFPVENAFRLPSAHWRGLPMVPLAPLSMSAVGTAFLVGGWLKRQYPALTPSTAGLTFHVVSVHLMSYLPPFLFLAAGSGLWAIFSGHMYGTALTPLAIGWIYLLVGYLIAPHALTRPFKVAGYSSLLFASVTALYSGSLALLVLSVIALICLGLSVREGSLLAHLWFVGAVMGAGGLAALAVWPGETLFLSVLYVGLLGVCRWLLTREGRGAEVLLTFGGAQLLGIGVVGLGVDLARGHLVGSWGFLVIGLGFLGLMGGWEGRQGMGGRWWAGLGHGVAHAAGGAWLLTTLRGWGVATGYEGLTLAGWAWGYEGVSRVLTRQMPGRVGTAAVRWGVHGFALLALFLAALHTATPFPLLVVLLSDAALYLSMSSPARAKGKLRVLGYVLMFTAVSLAFANSVRMAAVTLSASALLCLWLSVREGSLLAHLWFVGAVMGAGGLAAFAVWPGETLFLSVLYVGLLGVCRWLLTMEGRGTEGLLTFGGAQLVGIGMVGFDLARGPLGSWGFLLIWLGFLSLMGGWEGRQGVGAQWWAGLGHGVAHGAGGAWLLTVLKSSGVPAGYEGLALAGWAWGYWGVFQLLGRYVPGRVGTAAVGWGVHGFALLALFFAATHFMEGWLSILTYLLITALYLTFRLATGWEPLEHMAAGAFLGAIALWGLTSQIRLPEFYMSPLGIYLSLVLYRKSYRRLVNQGDVLASPVFRSDARRWVRLIRETLLPASILLVFVISPFLALLESLQPIHAFFLGAGATISVWLFLLTRQRPLFVYLVCLFLLLGVIYLLAFGDPDRLVIVFLVAVGHLITANMVFMRKSS